MPEIKNESKHTLKPLSVDPSTPAAGANPDQKFIIPKRGVNKWIIATLILILVMSGICAIYFLTKSKPVLVESQNETNIAEVEKEPEVLNTNYYATVNNEAKKITIYEYSGSSALADKKIGEFNGNYLNIAGKYLDSYTYIVTTDDGNINVLDAANAKLTPLFKEDPKKLVRGISISENKKFLAYGLNTEGDPNTGEIWIYDLETKEKSQLVKKTELGTYQGFSILGWRNNDQELIVSALGGDAGAVWGDIYQVDAKTGELTKVTITSSNKEAQNYFIRGSLSPDHEKWLYTYCEKPDTEAEADFGASQSCASGAELRTYDFETKKTSLVYQNLRYENNNDKNMLRSIMSFVWQDSNTIIATVPGAMLKIDAKSSNKEPEVLYEFDQYNPQKFAENYTGVTALANGLIFFLRDARAQVYNPVSKKVEVLNVENGNISFATWLN